MRLYGRRLPRSRLVLARIKLRPAPKQGFLFNKFVSLHSKHYPLYSKFQTLLSNNPRINQQITAPELRVLDEAGKNLGVIAREQALAMSLEKGLDLIEIAPTAKPPVARIMSFDKYRYEEEKRWKKERASRKSQEMKQVQIGVKTAANDLELKRKKVEEFLNEGHPVTIAMVLRGREKANRDWAKQKLYDFLKMITVEHTATAPQWGMRGFRLQVTKK